MKEADFQANVIQLARMFGWRVAHFRPARTKYGWKTPMQGDPGFPDLVLARDGRVIFAELKSDTGKLSPEQGMWLSAIDPYWEDTPRLPIRFAAYVWRPSDIDEIGKVLR